MISTLKPMEGGSIREYIDIIVEECAGTFRVTPDDIMSKSRRYEIAMARHTAMSLSYEMIGYFPKRYIAAYYGRTRMTLIHSLWVYNGMYETYPDYRRKCDDTKARIRQRFSKIIAS